MSKRTTTTKHKPEFGGTRKLKFYLPDDEKAQHISDRTGVSIVEILRRAAHAGLAAVEVQMAPLEQLSENN
jgi:hypothetical protein